MPGKNKVEYKRVDKKDDDYKRILVKFNPRFLRGSDFEIEFIPFEEGVGIGRGFVTEIDSMSTIDLYRWAVRQMCLFDGLGKYQPGTIIPKDVNLAMADILREDWRKGKVELEPRQIVSRVKQVFEFVANEFSKETAFTFNHFLYSGQLAALPYDNAYFSVERLKTIIEETPYPARNVDGDEVERTLVEHLFDTYKTGYVVGAIENFLEAMRLVREEIIEKYEEERKPWG